MKLEWIFLSAFFTSFCINIKAYATEKYNFQNLFKSIANHNNKRGQIDYEILKKNAVKEQHTFDTMKENFWTVKRSAVERKYFHTKMNIDQNGTMNKRETYRNNGSKHHHLPLETKPMRERLDKKTASSSAPLQFNDAICKRICVTAISDLSDTFGNYHERFIGKLQFANESMAYDISEKLSEVKRKVYQRKLLLEKVRDKTPCDCAEEFTKIEDYEDKVDEAYDSLLIRFDKIDEEEYYTRTTATQITTNNYRGYMDYWHHRMMDSSTHNPLPEIL